MENAAVSGSGSPGVQISSVAVLLPLAVAAFLAPPAGIVGMAGAIGRWDFATNGLFLLLLQLGGINFSSHF